MRRDVGRVVLNMTMVMWSVDERVVVMVVVLVAMVETIQTGHVVLVVSE